MIGVVDVEIQAKNPNLPLWPLRAYINSPSSIRLRNVPRKVGQWQITSVQFVVNYPDKTQKTAQCVLHGNIWVGTVEGCSTSGSFENGYTVLADGTDENGNPVSGYVLGRGDVEILKEDGTPIEDPTHFVTDDELDAAISSKAEISDVDDVANDLTNLSNSLSDYYTKNETSSAVEIDAKFETKADLSALNEVADSLSDYYLKSETSSTVEIQTALDGKQPTGDYALTSQLPTKISELSNDSGYITSAQVEPSTVLGMNGYAANSEYATRLKALDTGTGLPTDRGIIIPAFTYDSATNNYTLDLYGSVAGYHPWILRRLFGTDFSPVITLEWRKGTIYRKRVIGGTARWSVVYTNNWMWLAKGQYAITCPTGDGKPDGKFYVLNYEDETHPNYINDPATDVHTITYNNFNITSIDGQAGGQYEQAIWCTRVSDAQTAIWERPFAYRNELSAKADLSALNVVENSLSDYYTKSETSSATEIQNALDGKQPTGNYALVSQIPLSVSQLENDAGYLTAHQSLSNYYTKSETSSNVEISTALNLKQDTLTSEQLSNIARVPYIDPANTIVTFDDDSVGVYNIVGELTQNIKQEWERLAGAYVKDIKIGTNVNALGNSLFYRAYNNILTKVTIPNSVTSIGSGAFSGCTNLTKVTIPNSVTNIPNSAFLGCSNLTSVTIPNGVTSIEGFAFRSCTSLSSVTIPESTTNIGENAFLQSGITNITIPNSISSIGNDAFFGCSNLTSLTFKGKTLAEVQAMSNYPWGISDTSIIKTWNDASQEWVLEQLSALEARIAALENN